MTDREHSVEEVARLKRLAEEWWDDSPGSEYGCPDSLYRLLQRVADETREETFKHFRSKG